jgi:hypothetical protein
VRLAAVESVFAGLFASLWLAGKALGVFDAGLWAFLFVHGFVVVVVVCVIFHVRNCQLRWSSYDVLKMGSRCAIWKAGKLGLK